MRSAPGYGGPGRHGGARTIGGVLERPPAATIPDSPGSYQFLDADERIIYVGKAKSLRSRVGSYFQSPAQLAPRTAQMVGAAATVEWITVATEVERHRAHRGGTGW